VVPKRQARLTVTSLLGPEHTGIRDNEIKNTYEQRQRVGQSQFREDPGPGLAKHQHSKLLKTANGGAVGWAEGTVCVSAMLVSARHSERLFHVTRSFGVWAQQLAYLGKVWRTSGWTWKFSKRR
jgi:hypothetical protein